MASLILRGDLKSDGVPVPDSRVLSIPLLIDDQHGASSPSDRLFVDLVHIALQRAFNGDEPLAPEAFIVNFSIGVRGAIFTRSISSLARLLDWWSETAGVLFMVSAGNVTEDLVLSDLTTTIFEDTSADDRRKQICAELSACQAERSLLAPAEAMNAITVGAVSEDLAPPEHDAPLGELSFGGDGQVAISSAIGLGAMRSIKPDIVCVGGRQNIRPLSSGDDIRLRVAATSRTGLNTASSTSGVVGSKKERGTSCANALATRAALKTAAALTEEGGPFEGQDLPRRDLALLAKCLLVTSARWPKAADDLYSDAKAAGGHHSHHKETVARFYGHGLLDEQRAVEAPSNGTTLIGLGTLRKDRANIFDLPLPPSMSGQKLPRSMIVTLAWFSPVEPARSRYRLAALEAIAADDVVGEEAIGYPDWVLSMKAENLDANQIKRGTVWSKRMVQKNAHVPTYDDDAVLPIRVQCRDSSGGGLSPDDDIRFAITVTLETEVETEFDIHDEIKDRLAVLVMPQG